MNKYVDRMRKALQSYYAKAIKADEETRTAASVYIPDVADKEASRIAEALSAERERARAEIEAAESEGFAAVEMWGALDGEKLTDDAKLLRYDIPAADFARMVEKYKDNATMLFVLRRYAEQEGRGDTYFNLNAIPTEENKKAALAAFCGSALSLLASISAPDGFGQGVNSELIKTAVDNFGEMGTGNAMYYNML